MAELMRLRRQAEQSLDAARTAGDEEAFFDYFKQLAILDEQIEFMPHLADRWVDQVAAGAVDLEEFGAACGDAMDMIVRAAARCHHTGDHLAVERAGDAIDALRQRLTTLLQ